MRLLVCGDRNWKDKGLINKVLLSYWMDAPWETLTIIHGCAKGVDSLAGEIGKENSQKILEFPAQWDKFGKSAGPIRNQQMLDKGKPDLVLAFHDNIEESKGTKDMVNRAKNAGLEVRVYSHNVFCKVYPSKRG
jgi:hypothetical protein